MKWDHEQLCVELRAHAPPFLEHFSSALLLFISFAV